MNKIPIIGIQGGMGSFNELALFSNVRNFEIKYLYNTKNVFAQLKAGKIDFGQFAVSNSQSGIVMESFKEIAANNFKIVQTYCVEVSQNMLIRKDISKEKIKAIMAHPQTFAQCKNSLRKKYPHIKQVIGKNKLIDPAFVAQKLSNNKLPKTIAIIGSSKLADIYDLQIVDKNLQDDKKNLTSFLLISLKNNDFTIDLV